jgi:hypothetical protein
MTAQGVPDPWWRRIQMPDTPTRTSLLENVQVTPASVFDPSLPAISLERWLSLTLTPLVEVVYPHRGLSSRYTNLYNGVDALLDYLNK